MYKRLLRAGKRALSEYNHRIYQLPVLLLLPHSRCNCRCVMCDIWKANQNGRELTFEDFRSHLESLRRLEVQQVVFSGGEALMHSNLWTFCAALRAEGIRITLLSTGLLLRSRADEVVTWSDEVIVSLDGSEAVHDRIRNVPAAYRKLKDGVAALRERDPGFPVTGRCVLQRLNFRDFPHIIEAARDTGLDQISFLGADVSSLAFNRPKPLADERVAEISLTPNEVGEFGEVLERTLASHRDAFASGFVAESPAKLRRIVRYYAALAGEAELPPVRCNAPWVSAVVETNGDVLPCFFHPKMGNIFEDDLADILNSEGAVAFRRRLDVATNPVCRKCVCSLYLRPGAEVGT